MTMPDFNKMAVDFDRFLPQVHPVTLAILDHLPPPADGQTVLDVACGTGEPGLTLLRRSPGVHLLGVDSAAAMIEVAQHKAAREALTNARFEVMASEKLALPDASVDAVISRFGLLLFGDVAASARELSRVLRPRGAFSLAVWEDMERNTLVNATWGALRGHLPKDHDSPMERFKEWAGDGVRTRLLADAGLGVVRSEMFRWHYQFDDFEGAWSLMSRMGHFTGQDALPAEVQQIVKQDVCNALSAYKKESGAYAIPHTCRLIWGEQRAG